LKLAKLPKVLPGTHSPVPEEMAEIDVTGVAHDSRRIKPGWVFVAIPGHERDGGDFIEDALSRGAVAVVTERPLRTERPVLQFIVQDARRALAALANTFHNKPSRRLQVIGVTGTNGKTTTCYMVRSILQHAGQRCGLLGTIHYDTGRRVLPASITTPESVDIQEFLAEMVAEGMDSAVMEVSSHSLCMHRVDFVQFAVGVFTNLSPEHMDYHRTFTGYRDAKTMLFRGLGPASIAVLNADDKASEHIQGATFARVLRYGLKARSDVTAKVRSCGIDGIRMTLRCPAGETDVTLPLIGIHNASNALAAASVAWVLGYDLAAIRAGLEQLPSIPGRLEPVPYPRPCKVLVDFAHTEQALKSVLTSLRKVAEKRIIVVFGAGGDRDKTKRPRMGRVVEQHADLAWVTSDNPRGEEPMAIIEEILSGMKGRSRVHVQPDRQAAISEALQSAEAGDLVLIAGKGHERTQRFRDTVIPFDDREAVGRAVAASG
jgi:UDP-N-acetylmuramoyl-L-alanyl-D-glutamate--2,6-diaminopimelate ligase